jgi:aryl-alcohol dehydrogenase-like predicted oxidoreductase
MNSMAAPRWLSRRAFIAGALGGLVLAMNKRTLMAQSIILKAIPRSGELLPAVGLGTWQTFDVGGNEAARAPLRAVLREFAALGGSVIDSSPMYGNSENVTGDLTQELGLRKQLFLATKVWTSGRDAGVRQMEESFRRLRTERMDLLQVHNLVDYRTHLATLRRWKEEGRIRYIGVTHYTASAYSELARVIANEDLDFVQLNYSLAERDAEKRLLPLAAERRLAVLANRPFAEGRMFRIVKDKALPAWSREIGCASWAQFFLKFIISHPAVTCAIPATRKVEHLTDNMAASIGTLPDAPMRDRMARLFRELT